MNTHYMHGNKAGIMFALLTILGCIVWSTPVRADIYCWTDSGGVIHFSNHNPPPEAEFFMVEQPTGENPVHEAKPTAALPKRDPLQDQLTEAHRKLEKALDKVDDLTEKVEQTRREARNAADAAQRAQAKAEIASENRTERHRGSMLFPTGTGRTDHVPNPITGNTTSVSTHTIRAIDTKRPVDRTANLNSTNSATLASLSNQATTGPIFTGKSG